jgi:hypothetical protein
MFAILMYVLGFLLLSIPLPKSAGLKRYARKMIHDSFNLVLTIVILDFFLGIVLSWQDVVWCSIYGTTTTQCGMIGIEAFQKKTYELIIAAHQTNMNTVNTWALITTGIVTVGHAILGLATRSPWDVLLAPYYGAQAGANIASQLGNIFGQISQLYGVALVASDVFVYYAEFIYLNWGVLAGLGVLLCVFPFGIGKRAGFFLVVFPVVSFIMLPLQAFVGPLIAQYMAGFTAGMGFSVLGSFVDPNVIGLLCVPALYLTFTSLATGSLAAFSGASSIPIRGLPSLGALGGRFGATIRQTGKQTFTAAKKTKGILKDQYRSVKHGGHEVGYSYTLTGTTASGERVEVRARKRGDGFVYPSKARTTSGKVVNVDQMVEEGRMEIRSSALPHARLRHGFKWGRDDAFSRARGAYDTHQTKKRGEWTAGPGPIPKGTRGGRPGAPGEKRRGETTGREHAKRERQTDRTGQTEREKWTGEAPGRASSEHVRSGPGPGASRTPTGRTGKEGKTTEAPGSQTTEQAASHEVNRTVGEARYDTNSTFRDKWREHMRYRGFGAEELRRHFIDSFATWKTHGLGALDAGTAAFFRVHMAGEAPRDEASQTGQTGTGEAPGREKAPGAAGASQFSQRGKEQGREYREQEAQEKARQTRQTGKTSEETFSQREQAPGRERTKEAETGAGQTREEETQRQAQYAVNRSVAEAKYDTNPELQQKWHAGHRLAHDIDASREDFIHSFTTWKTHGLGALNPHSAEFFRLHAARFRL